MKQYKVGDSVVTFPEWSEIRTNTPAIIAFAARELKRLGTQSIWLSDFAERMAVAISLEKREVARTIRISLKYGADVNGVVIGLYRMEKQTNNMYEKTLKVMIFGKSLVELSEEIRKPEEDAIRLARATSGDLIDAMVKPESVLRVAYEPPEDTPTTTEIEIYAIRARIEAIEARLAALELKDF